LKLYKYELSLYVRSAAHIKYVTKISPNIESFGSLQHTPATDCAFSRVTEF